MVTHYFYEIEEAKKNWGWFLALGVVLALLGAFMIHSAFFATIVSMMAFGAVLIGAGAVQIIQAFMAKKWSGFFLSLLLGVLYCVTGFMSVTKPGMSAAALTLLIATLCLIGGIFRMIASLMIRFEKWGWMFINGAITFILGLMIYSEWPLSGFFVIGLFIGVDLILMGIFWIALAISARRTKKRLFWQK